jgi:hypothetical protein
LSFGTLADFVELKDRPAMLAFQEDILDVITAYDMSESIIHHFTELFDYSLLFIHFLFLSSDGF